MNVRDLLTAFDRWRAAAAGMVLATVYETAGSTYSKAGARMLINDAGQFQGMLSGGCLEGDLAERAATVLASGIAQSVTYDLGQNDEELWGLGVGCDGLMRIFLQPLDAERGYQPFADMADVFRGDDPAVAITVLDSIGSGPVAGATAIQTGSELQCHSLPESLLATLADDIERCLAGGATARLRPRLDGDTRDLLVTRLAPPPRILVLGGGLDAEPLVRLLCALGWRVVLQDHRPAYIAKGNFDGAEAVLNLPAADLAAEVDPGRFAAAVVMSHHLDTDRVYLDWLAASDLPYIGLLGPVDRRRRLLGSLGSRAARLEGRVHGPAGLDLGGRGPAAIALSIAAEMHAVLVRYDGAPPPLSGAQAVTASSRTTG